MLEGLPADRAKVYLNSDGPQDLNRALNDQELTDRMINDCKKALEGK